MKMKKFMAAGLLCLIALTGCNSAQTTTGSNVQSDTETASVKEVEESTAPAESETAAAETETPEATETPEVSANNNEVATEQIKTLAGMIGKTAHDVNLALGQPAMSKNIENSKVLAANYYKVEFCNEVAKIEVDFDVDTQNVNYISFTIMSADDVEASKETFINVLTSLYGESTIERYMNVKGKQRRDWNDGTLDYDLKYYENNISLDIYPLDK